jgi:hypothetical protein
VRAFVLGGCAVAAQLGAAHAEAEHPVPDPRQRPVPGLTRSTGSYSTQSASSVDSAAPSCLESPVISEISAGRSA